MQQPTIEIAAVNYKQPGPLKVFVQSVLNQSQANWKLTVMHDGPDPEFLEVMSIYNDPRIAHSCTSTRYNDYGHSLRHLMIQNSTSDYLVLTNSDNYLVPRFVEYLNDALSSHPDVDVVIYDMVHGHNNPGGRPLPSHSYFNVEYKPFHIDMGAALVKTSLAKKVGFDDKGFDGDQTYFKALSYLKQLSVVKVQRVLFVHN